MGGCLGFDPLESTVLRKGVSKKNLLFTVYFPENNLYIQNFYHRLHTVVLEV